MQAAVADCGRDEPLVAYAVKANPNPAVLATLARAGLGADVVSIGEYRKARAAGIEANRIRHVDLERGLADPDREAVLCRGKLDVDDHSARPSSLAHPA